MFFSVHMVYMTIKSRNKAKEKTKHICFYESALIYSILLLAAALIFLR